MLGHLSFMWKIQWSFGLSRLTSIPALITVVGSTAILFLAIEEYIANSFFPYFVSVKKGLTSLKIGKLRRKTFSTKFASDVSLFSREWQLKISIIGEFERENVFPLVGKWCVWVRWMHYYIILQNIIGKRPKQCMYI